MSNAATIELDDALRSRVELLVSRRGQAVDAFVRDALSELLRREEQRESFLADAAQAWHDYQATGLHTTFEEVEEWLARLEAGEDAVPPECHV